MILGELNFGEIAVFFRYRSFPIALNVLMLFAWAYLLLIYINDRKEKSYFYLALGTAVLFLKEIILFFSVRHVAFGEGSDPIRINLTDWLVLETLSTYFFTVCMGVAYTKLEFKQKFDYPPPEIFNRFRRWTLVNAVILLSVIIYIYFSKATTIISPTFILPLLAIFYLMYIAFNSNRIRINYNAFSGGWLNRYVQYGLLGYLGAMILIYIFFTGTSVLIFVDNISNQSQLAKSFAQVSNDYYHAFKFYAYLVYIIFIFMLITKDYGLTAAARSHHAYIMKEVGALGAKMRRQVLRYEPPPTIIQTLLRDALAYTQAEFAFLCYYKDNGASLDYHEHVSDSSYYNKKLKKIDVSTFLKNIVDRKLPIIIDELDETSPAIKDYYAYLNVSDEDPLVFDENKKHFPCPVESLMVVPVWQQRKLRYTLILINKKKDYFEEWTENTTFAFLKNAAEEISFISEYLLEYNQFLSKRNKVFDLRMGNKQSAVIATATQNIRSNFPAVPEFTFATASAYPDLPNKTVVSVGMLQKKKPTIMLTDINGETAARSYIAGTLHASFFNSVESENKLSAIMKKLNTTLALTQQKNYVSANLYFYDKDRRKFFFSNAAHTPLLIFHQASGELIAYDIDDPPLSIDVDPVYRDASTDINEGDIIISHSAELAKLKNADGDVAFDAAKIASIVKTTEDAMPQTIVDRLVWECQQMPLPVTTQIVFLIARVGKIT